MNVPSMGDRLREVRGQLGLSQQALADQCGITMRSQRNYEKDERQPDAVYLAALAAAGADVLYILTGQRAGETLVAPPTPPAATREDLARGTEADPAWPQVMEWVYDALRARRPAAEMPTGRKLRDMVTAVLVVLRLEEGEMNRETARRKIAAIL